jgi:HK97 family phage portal protein
MGFLTRLRGAPAAAEKSASGYPGAPSVPMLPGIGTLQTASGMQVNQVTALQVSTIRRCVSIRSIDTARCRPSIVRPDVEGKRESVTDHPLAQIFRRPNKWQSWFEFAEQMQGALLLRGNAYAVKIRDWRGQLTALIPVNPDLVVPLEAPNGEIFYNVSRAGLWLMAVLDGLPVAIPGEDMFHLRDATLNTLVGGARIVLAREAIGLAMSQEAQAARWAGNGARPSGILQSDKPLTLEVAKRLKDQWQKMQGGVHNAGQTAVLEDGIKWQPMQMTSVDLEFNGSRLTQVREIARFFDVPLHKLMEADSQTRATIAELNSDYVQTTVMGDLTRWERRIEVEFGLSDEGLECSFDESELLRADVSTMRNIARLGFLSGLITQNEARDEIGYGPVPGGDVLMPPVNLAPNGSAIDGTAADNAGRPPQGELPKPNAI